MRYCPNFALKVYLKTKKMTNISQAQAGFKANSRRNPLWISRLFNAKSSCVCRNRLNFRLFRYTLGQIKTTGSPHATGFTHECYSLYEIIIACLSGICKGSFAQELYWAFCADCTRKTLWKMPFEARQPTVVQ